MSRLRVVKPATVYLLKNEVAEKLRVKPRTVDRYRRQGLPAHRRYNRVWFDEAEVDAWVKGGAA